MEQISWSTVIVAAIGVISAWLSARAAKKASQSSANASTANEKTKAEAEAYQRARTMDIATIKRQDEELVELIEKVRSLEEKNRSLDRQNEALRKRVSSLELRRKSNG